VSIRGSSPVVACANWHHWSGHMATNWIASASRLQGPAEVLGLEPSTAVELLAAIRAGLPFAALEVLAAQLDLPSVEIAVLLGIPARTFARRRKTDQLTAQESDRLFRLARTVAQAIEVLGALAKARLWLLAPNRSRRFCCVSATACLADASVAHRPGTACRHHA
jgi:putative toxin-antitoxin system antitoxin component (TIGR02293 family)